MELHDIVFRKDNDLQHRKKSLMVPIPYIDFNKNQSVWARKGKKFLKHIQNQAYFIFFTRSSSIDTSDYKTYIQK